MATILPTSGLEQMLDSLSQCFTVETAKKLLKVKANAKLKARAETLAGKCNRGDLTPAERAEYEGYVHFSTFLALLKSKARRMLN